MGDATSYGQNLTDMMMVNPWMFDPTQQSNQFSNYNNQALPWPPTYNGTPVSAATGKPIQSYQDWLKANPVTGTTLNSAPSPQPSSLQSIAQNNPMLGQVMGWQSLSNPEMYARGQVTGDPNLNAMIASSLGGQGGVAAGTPMMQQQANQPVGATPGTTQGASAPNNWYAALNALANPGNPTTPGATVPMQQGYQPAGGINQAFLQARGMGGGGMPSAAPMGMNNAPANMNFLSALQALQNRPQ